MIKYNPLYKNNGQLNGALTTPPSESIVFDVPGKCIWVKGVKLKGTDTTYTFSNDNYITLTNTPGDPEDIKIGVNITTLKSVIDTTYDIVSTTANGLAPRYVSANIAESDTTVDSYLLGWQGSTLKWYKLPYREIKINNTQVLSSFSKTPLTFMAGTGVSIEWDSTNNKIVITNTKPDINHNTDFQVGQYATSSDSDYRILLKKSTNDTEETATARFATTLTYNPSSKELKVNSQKVIHTGNIDSANATIGDTLTTIATLGGVEIKAKVDFSQYAQLSQWDIIADKASFELTQEWTDSGVGLSGLSPGPCLLYINYCGVHYTGIFAYSGTTINTDDEFPLHCSGYTQLDRGRIFAKIAAVQGATKLMLAAQKPETNIPLFTIKIKQIAIL